MSEDLLVLSHMARVSVLSRDTNLPELLKERNIFDEDILASHPPFFFRAEISNDLLDSHFTHMSEKTLRNYVEDANRGVAFLKGHDWKSLPIGYSLSATYEDVADKKRAIADFYTITGLFEADDLIVRMKSGLLRDVSVGFHGGEMICDICHQDFWDCRHWPGLKYEIKEGDVIRQIVATYTIDDAKLSEVSGVFDGSTPEAMILKAQRHAAAGLLSSKEIDILQQCYRVALPSKKSFGVSHNQREVVKMDEKQFQRIVGVLVDSGIVPEDQRSTVDDETLVVYVDKLAKRLQTVEPQAAEGIQYRKDLVEQALAEGVRAQGNEFDRALYETTLNASPLPVVKRMLADWKKVADAGLPAGRSTVQEDQTPSKKEVVPELYPDEAFA